MYNALHFKETDCNLKLSFPPFYILRDHFMSYVNRPSDFKIINNTE